MLIKLGLSKKFPQIALCIRKNTLGIKFISLTTIIVILKLKLYIGNKRKSRNIIESIEVYKEL